MKKKIVGILICTLLFATTMHMAVTANEEPMLKVDIQHGFPYLQLIFIVKNIGDATIHNVTFTDVNISGNVVYNNRGHIAIYNNNTNDIEPGNQGYGTIDSLIVGRGLFTVIVTVTSDEGTFYSDKTYGLIFGPFIIVL